MPHTHFSQSGQVGIAVILVMVVMTTIGISLATRSASDVRTARQSQEATQTFSAAEAALEDILSRDQQYLEDTSTGEYTDVENVTVNYSVGKQNELTTELLQGSTAEVDVSSGSVGQQVVIEWAENVSCGSGSPASLLVSVINTAGAEPIARHYAYSPCDRADGMEVISAAGSIYDRQVVLTLESGDQYLRVTPIYGDTNILVNGNGWTLPTQEFTINSVAQNQLGRETKAIEVERTTEYAPTLLDYSLVSGTTIIK
ncbi:pilus assembly PilX N-terminal domain-containing protein [Candidatus Woesebacteria bacterium]|nr:pilus assembly PilX N-terminal domain-containing protein [Candidatus Woesebacteria bacterium]MCD8507253.1 pilus assembly PilX N-terminal domain-containing protein [Candidatus Woesebacteria bacterium]MCD8526612.1 pilus assembly PilX N-terminal domain-containing protein [Candidatus Woesebacteria bacterium]MCD8546008.1 pilus assembly PilX N-terminal domain-containing protein [Candidatus Woesebacteria bacterium]